MGDNGWGWKGRGKRVSLLGEERLRFSCKLIRGKC